MSKSKYDMIIEGLGGSPITELKENWTFTIKEVAPYVYKVKAWDINGLTSFGAGGTAEEALDNCLRRVEKIISYQNRKSEIKNKIMKIFRIGG
jgi:hypothetical protein